MRENNVDEFDTISTRVLVAVGVSQRQSPCNPYLASLSYKKQLAISGYRKIYLMSSTHPCQKFHHILTTCIRRQLEWGLTVAVHRNRTDSQFGGMNSPNPFFRLTSTSCSSIKWMISKVGSVGLEPEAGYETIGNGLPKSISSQPGTRA